MMKLRKLLLFSVILVFEWPVIINFTPVTAADTFVDETVSVPAGTYRYYSFNTNYDNIKLVIKIEVLSGNDINVHVTDEPNFHKWIEGESSQGYLSRQRMVSFTADITLGPAGKYYVILDNSYSIIASKSVHILIKASLDQSKILEFLFLGFIVIMGGGGFFAIILIVKRRSTPRTISPPPMIPPASPSSVPPVTQPSYGFCPSCGNPINHSGKFCMKCGQRVPSKEK